MRKIFIFIQLFFISVIMAQERKIDPEEILKPLPKDFKDSIGVDESSQTVDYDISISIRKQALEQIKDYILDIEDCPENCKKLYEDSLPILCTSKIDKNIVDHMIDFYIFLKNDSKYDYHIKIKYYIFSNEEKAPLTLRVLFTGFSMGYPTDDPIIKRVNSTYTGKKIGEFSIRGPKMDEKNNIYSFSFFYRRIYVYFYISADPDVYKVKPEDIDIWAEAILNKIKKGLGEKVEIKK